MKSSLHSADMHLERLIHNYTREAGVRQLERKIGDICRKAAKEILETKKKRISDYREESVQISWQRECILTRWQITQTR